jgi:D-alanyl-lipoteichoic acid acyltransferase DltB (MBOAT superfamily)
MVFKPVYLLILFSIILIDFIAGKGIEKSTTHKKIWLIISLTANLGILFFFKYFNFFNENINALFSIFHWHLKTPLLEMVLPIGLSFHTFQAMSYTIEVYRGNQPAERNLLDYSIYVLYFPQLVAGPIERPQNLLPQIKKSIRFNWHNIATGLFIMAIGLFKKVVIADRLALFVDPVFNDLSNANGLSVLIAIIFFSFEIYCDFSGYSDMAIGASKMMGIDLMQNFNSPYLSGSFSEFWSRWHISLSSWFKAYLYKPLGGNRKGENIQYRNIFIVFLLSGLWHGAAWNYVVWGALHGMFLILENIFKKLKIFSDEYQIPQRSKVLYVFCMTTFAWIFFRAQSLSDAIIALKHLLSISLEIKLPHTLNEVEFLFSLLLIYLLIISERKQWKTFFYNPFKQLLLSIVIFSLCYLFGEFNLKQFIYFQF